MPSPHTRHIPMVSQSACIISTPSQTLDIAMSSFRTWPYKSGKGLGHGRVDTSGVHGEDGETPTCPQLYTWYTTVRHQEAIATRMDTAYRVSRESRSSDTLTAVSAVQTAKKKNVVGERGKRKGNPAGGVGKRAPHRAELAFFKRTLKCCVVCG